MSKEPVNKQTAIDAWAKALQSESSIVSNRIKTGVWKLQFGPHPDDSPDRCNLLRASVASENEPKNDEVINRLGALAYSLGNLGFDDPWTQMLGWSSDEKLETSPMKFGFREKDYLLSFSWERPAKDKHELVIHVEEPERKSLASAPGKKSLLRRSFNSMSLQSSKFSKASGGRSGSSGNSASGTKLSGSDVGSGTVPEDDASDGEGARSVGTMDSGFRQELEDNLAEGIPSTSTMSAEQSINFGRSGTVKSQLAPIRNVGDSDDDEKIVHQ